MFNTSFGQQSGNTGTGFGGFGQPQQPATGSSLFGQPAQPAQPAPSGFGAPAASSPFGGALGSGTQPQLGQPAMGQQQQGQGTGTVPFTPHEANDPIKAGKIDRYETITMMPEYANSTLQELRWQDYQANRKGPSGPMSTGFGFGQAPSTGGAFGQASQSSPFGSTFGGGSTTTGGSLFGQNNNNSNTATTSGGGLFGNNNAPSTGGAFGNTTGTSGGLFGQNNNQQGGAFGSAATGGGFGSTPAANTSGGFGFGNNNNAAAGNTGSLFGQNSNTNSGSSLFGGGAKPGGFFGQQPAAPAATGTGFGFGAAAGQPQGNAFGANNSGSGLFGQNNTGGNSMFGQNKPSGSLFGQQGSAGTGTGAFGQSSGGATLGGSSLFGQNNNNNNNAANTSGFGFNQNKGATGMGLFGQANNANNSTPTNTGSSPFGQANAQPSSGGMFGQNNTSTFGQSQPQQGGFGFGSAQNKPSGGLFGQNPSTPTNAFGQANQAGGSGPFGASNTGGGLFGQNNQQQQGQAQSGGFGFGAPKPPANNSTLGGGTGGLFGQSQQPQRPLFGAQNNTSMGATGSGGFGSTLNKPAGGSLFGQNNAAGTGAAGGLGGGGGLFGSNNTAGNTGASPFGANNNTSGTNNGNPSGGLFGGSTFGNNNANTANNNNASGGLFGSKPASGPGLLGNTGAGATSGGGLFGNSGNAGGTGSMFSSFGGNQQGQANTGSGLFGNKPATGGGLFGGSKPTLGGGSATGFGGLGSQQSGLSQQTVPTAPMASIDGDAYLSNPLFKNIQQPSDSTAQSEQPYATSKKDAASFKPPTGILIAQIMQPNALPRGKRIGGKTTSSPASGQKEIEATATTDTATFPSQKQAGDADRFRNVLFSNSTDDIILNTEAFDFARSGVKAIGMESVRSTNPQAISVSTPTKKGGDETTEGENEDYVIVSPSISRIDESGAGLGNVSGADALQGKEADREGADQDDDGDVSPSADGSNVVAPDTPDNEVVDSHGYWISPAKHKLASMTLREIRQIKDFRVGQRTQGFVEFLEPVDLSMFSDVQAQVCGHTVVFGDRSFCLYPIESERPPVGQGFNKKHRVTLYNIFARKRDTKEPIKDPEHPLARKFMKRLQSQGNFVSWSAQTGTWTFEVDPASK